ncbi:kinase-like protein [Polyporus arcularius HHB13444]|uniref:non-specific serine/threonine protein kinase n=1 Tax=Polyporus arcularius HHB13444 TaxID=1314778 RepID=A0A5C3NMP6_9APHY|nr:kinase-like protein [Polyporus arcularius HHB13444]
MKSLVYCREWFLGRGSYGRVFEAVDKDTGQVVAVKISRVSARVWRSVLRHEARLLQLVQGHPSVPEMIGYLRIPHFEYLAMELLGESLRQKIRGQQSLQHGTVARIGEQMLSALVHIASHGVVHRDIKPDNILLSLTDSSRVVLIDFGIAHYLPAVKDLTNAREHGLKFRFPTGSLPWCSVRAHQDLPPLPQDDLESLAYVLLRLSLGRGGLPWQIPKEPHLSLSVDEAVWAIYAAKRSLTRRLLPVTVADEIADLLEICKEEDCTTEAYILKLSTLSSHMRQYALALGERDGDPLNWSFKPQLMRPPSLAKASSSSTQGSEPNPSEEPPFNLTAHLGGLCDNERYTNSYFYPDIALWDVVHGRRSSLTLPPHEEEMLDDEVPQLEDVDLVHEMDDDVKRFKV